MADTFTPMEVSARGFALAWRAVQAAASTDPNRPHLNATTLIEQFEDGVQLISTDGYVMLWSWVAGPEEFAVAPEIDEAPMASVLVADRSGLPKALGKYLLATTKLGGGEFDRKTTLELSVGVFDANPGQPTLGGAVDHPGLILTAYNETVVAPIVDLEFPDWRAIARHAPVKSTARVGLDGAYLSKLGGVKVDSARGVWLSFLGTKNGIAVEIPGWPSVHGRVMPLADETPRSAEVVAAADAAAAEDEPNMPDAADDPGALEVEPTD